MLQRRDVLKTGFSALLMATMSCSARLAAAGVAPASAANALSVKLAAALRKTGNPTCASAAGRLLTRAEPGLVDLHLRAAGLSPAHVEHLAAAMQSLTGPEASCLSSLSLSYNPQIGDAGVLRLTQALPRNLPELGLVGCQIGDSGGDALLAWVRQTTRLTMLCIEGNHFSSDLKERFIAHARANSDLSLYI